MWRVWFCVSVWCLCAACSVSTASLDELTCTPGEVSGERTCNSEGVWVRGEPVAPTPDMGMDMPVAPGDMMACTPVTPVCVPTSCGMFKASDGCGAEVEYSCMCGEGLICDEGACRPPGECELSTAQKRDLCEMRGSECELISVQDACRQAVTIDCTIVCEQDASCVDGACCTPSRVSDQDFVDTVCRTATSDELCGLQNDVPLGCGQLDTIDCQGCSDPLAVCEQGECKVPACPVNAQCGFVERGDGQPLACGTRDGACSAAELCENYQCTPFVSIAPPASVQAQEGLFGYAVAFGGDVLVVGEPLASDGRGAVHLYRRDASTRVFQYDKTLSSPAPQPGQAFGISVAIEGDWIAVGAPGTFALPQTPSELDPLPEGDVYLFERGSNDWSDPGAPVNKALFTVASSDSLRGFGYDVALAGDTLVVGAPLLFTRIMGKDRPIGGVFVFEDSGQGASWGAARQMPYPDRDDYLLGFSVDIREDGVVGGAPELIDRVGALYVWLRDAPGSWSDPPRVARNDGWVGLRVGYDVALNLNDAYLGVPGFDSGKGLVSGGPLGAGSFTTSLQIANGAQGAYLGSAVAVDDRTFAASASGFSVFASDSDNVSSVQGRVYIREFDGSGTPTTNSRLLALTAQDASSRWLGVGLDVEEGLVVVGAPHKSSGQESRVYLLKGY